MFGPKHSITWKKKRLDIVLFCLSRSNVAGTTFDKTRGGFASGCLEHVGPGDVIGGNFFLLG